MPNKVLSKEERTNDNLVLCNTILAHLKTKATWANNAIGNTFGLTQEETKIATENYMMPYIKGMNHQSDTIYGYAPADLLNLGKLRNSIVAALPDSNKPKFEAVGNTQLFTLLKTLEEHKRVLMVGADRSLEVFGRPGLKAIVIITGFLIGPNEFGILVEPDSVVVLKKQVAELTKQVRELSKANDSLQDEIAAAQAAIVERDAIINGKLHLSWQ